MENENPQSENPNDNQKKKFPYKIFKVIGEGAFGKVKLGIHLESGTNVAVKILEKRRIKEKDDKIRVSREIKILQTLSHQNIISVNEILQTKEKYYIVMEYCEGGELFNYITKRGRLSLKQSAFFFYQIINGLEYLHSKQIVHRDLKPENLLLSRNNVLKITDFGLSNFYSKGDLLSTPCGSPCYASPEMVTGKKYDGVKIDIWSTGIILYAMICGYLPFEDKDHDILFEKISECKVEYPSELMDNDSIDILSKILVNDPSKRISIDLIKEHSFYLRGKKLYDIEVNQCYDYNRLDGVSFSQSESMANSEYFLDEDKNEKDLLKEDNYKNKTALTQIKTEDNKKRKKSSNSGISNKSIQNGNNITNQKIKAITETNNVNNPIVNNIHEYNSKHKESNDKSKVKNNFYEGLRQEIKEQKELQIKKKRNKSSLTSNDNGNKKLNIKKIYVSQRPIRLNTEGNMITKNIHRLKLVNSSLSTSKNKNNSKNQFINIKNSFKKINLTTYYQPKTSSSHHIDNKNKNIQTNTNIVSSNRYITYGNQKKNTTNSNIILGNKKIPLPKGKIKRNLYIQSMRPMVQVNSKCSGNSIICHSYKSSLNKNKSNGDKMNINNLFSNLSLMTHSKPKKKSKRRKAEFLSLDTIKKSNNLKLNSSNIFLQTHENYHMNNANSFRKNGIHYDGNITTGYSKSNSNSKSKSNSRSVSGNNKSESKSLPKNYLYEPLNKKKKVNSNVLLKIKKLSPGTKNKFTKITLGEKEQIYKANYTNESESHPTYINNIIYNICNTCNTCETYKTCNVSNIVSTINNKNPKNASKKHKHSYCFYSYNANNTTENDKNIEKIRMKILNVNGNKINTSFIPPKINISKNKKNNNSITNSINIQNNFISTLGETDQSKEKEKTNTKSNKVLEKNKNKRNISQMNEISLSLKKKKKVFSLKSLNEFLKKKNRYGY
ncbi:MAG: serine/threonine-protein kinase [archaeon]|nr:serine/threonine-protein kinase [archaeon]